MNHDQAVSLLRKVERRSRQEAFDTTLQIALALAAGGVSSDPTHLARLAHKTFAEMDSLSRSYADSRVEEAWEDMKAGKRVKYL